MKILDNLLYTQEHEWVRVEGNKAYIGITDYAQHALGDIVFVELPEVDSEVEKGDQLVAVESVKAASDVYAPVSGTIVEVNEGVSDDPALVNTDAFENWMVAVEISNKEELEELLSPKDYEKLCEEEA